MALVITMAIGFAIISNPRVNPLEKQICNPESLFSANTQVQVTTFSYGKSPFPAFAEDHIEAIKKMDHLF